MRYVVIVEHKKGSNYSAYVPDLPGCVAAAKTEREVLKLMKEAIFMHLEDILTKGEKPPKPLCAAREVEVAV